MEDESIVRVAVCVSVSGSKSCNLGKHRDIRY